MIYKDIFDSPIGSLYIAEEEGSIIYIGYEKGFQDYLKKNRIKPIEAVKNLKTNVIEAAELQLKEYFEGKRVSFDLTLKPKGTDFQLKTWRALLEIPYGKTCSYKDIAQAIDCPKGFRAVGMANNRNPIMLAIPCHRVIGSDGSLTGFGGGISAKQYLLELEGNKD